MYTSISPSKRANSSGTEIDINKLWIQCKDILPEEFDLFFEDYYKKKASKPKTISEAEFEDLLQLNERLLLEQMGYSEVPEIEAPSLKAEEMQEQPGPNPPDLTKRKSEAPHYTILPKTQSKFNRDITMDVIKSKENGMAVSDLQMKK